jgi:hypothetical protein
MQFNICIYFQAILDQSSIITQPLMTTETLTLPGDVVEYQGANLEIVVSALSGS